MHGSQRIAPVTGRITDYYRRASVRFSAAPWPYEAERWVEDAVRTLTVGDSDRAAVKHGPW